MRFAALRAIEEMALKLGDAYEALLPDTMTYVSELLEGTSHLTGPACTAASMSCLLIVCLYIYFVPWLKSGFVLHCLAWTVYTTGYSCKVVDIF